MANTYSPTSWASIMTDIVKAKIMRYRCNNTLIGRDLDALLDTYWDRKENTDLDDEVQRTWQFDDGKSREKEEERHERYRTVSTVLVRYAIQRLKEEFAVDKGEMIEELEGILADMARVDVVRRYELERDEQAEKEKDEKEEKD